MALRFVRLTASELTPMHRLRWTELADRSSFHSPWLQPEFYGALVRHHRGQTPDVVVVESPNDGRWQALALVEERWPSKSFPARHYSTPEHELVFRGGLLVDSERAPRAIDCLLTGLAHLRSGVVVPGLRLDSLLARDLEASASRLGFRWIVNHCRKVPAAFPQITTFDYLQRHWSSSFRKSLRRRRKMLQELGEVSLRLIDRPDETTPALDTFFRLEHASWKGAAGTSCLARPDQSRLLAEMIHGLAARGMVLMTELRAGDRVAASAINFTVQGRLFAFKIGWDAELARAAPGILHEADLLSAAAGPLSHFTLFDSCASESSYIAPIWPERIQVGTGMIAFTSTVQWRLNCLDAARRLRNRLGLTRQAPAPVASSNQDSDIDPASD